MYIHIMGAFSVTGTGQGEAQSYTTSQLYRLLSLLPGRFLKAFTESNIDAGELTVKHNLNSKYVVVFVYDQFDNKLIPDEINLVDENTTVLTLASFEPVVGTWNVIILG
jgi:hypothetical protein